MAHTTIKNHNKLRKINMVEGMMDPSIKNKEDEDFHKKEVQNTKSISAFYLQGWKCLKGVRIVSLGGENQGKRNKIRK